MTPKKPRNLVATVIPGQSAQVTWSADDATDTTSYYVEYKARGSNNTLLKVVWKHTTAILANLPVNQYQVRVRGVTAAGGGPWSEYTSLVVGHPGEWSQRRCHKMSLCNGPATWRTMGSCEGTFGSVFATRNLVNICCGHDNFS